MDIREMARLGGLARAAVLAPERRAAIARRGGLSRWHGPRPPEPPCASGHRACQHYEALLAAVATLQREFDFCLLCNADLPAHQAGCALVAFDMRVQ